MKIKIIKITFLLFPFFSLTAQIAEFHSSIGKFNNASSFDISAHGIIYVSDAGNDQIVSLDTLGKIIKTAGGFGWSDGSFDEPADVFANPLSIYVADKNNHRIQRFDRDLNFISAFSTRQRENNEAKFGYPSGFALSNQGDWYILDSENNRIVKFDLFGNFIQNFGGYDAGNYQLNRPNSLAISPENNVYVSDESGIVIFDSFGNGIGRIETPEQIISVRIIFDELVINTKNIVYHSNLREGNNKFSEIDLSHFNMSEIVSALEYFGRLYVLTSKEILIFTLSL